MMKKKTEHIPRGINWEALCKETRHTNIGCSGCFYATANLFCEYVLKEGKRRPVPMNPGGGCSCKIPVKTKSFVTADSKEALFSSRYLFSAKQRRQIKRLADYPDAEDEDKIRELYNRKMSDLQIALFMKCSKQSIYLWRKKRGLKSNFNPKEEKEEPKDEQGPGNQAEV